MTRQSLVKKSIANIIYNQIEMKRSLFAFIIITLLFYSCRSRNENNLSKKDWRYINEIIPLEENENIEFFETNGGLKGYKTTGSFITNKKLAYYWLDGKSNEVHFLKYDQIDSLKAVDRTKAAAYASYLEVYGANQHNFKIYVDADSARTWNFFNKAIVNWNNKQ